MWPKGLFVSSCIFFKTCHSWANGALRLRRRMRHVAWAGTPAVAERACGAGFVPFARWHVSDVRPLVASLPATACVFERCRSGPATLISWSHSSSVRKSCL